MIEVKGKKYLKEIVSKELIVKHQRNIKNAFANHGKRVTKALEKKIKTGSRTGRVYFFRGKRHKASAPGEPPANRSGRLAKSFKYKLGYDEMIVFSNAFSNKGAPYPFFLEEGTVKMDPRPFWESTIVPLHNDLARDLEFLGK